MFPHPSFHSNQAVRCDENSFWHFTNNTLGCNAKERRTHRTYGNNQFTENVNRLPHKFLILIIFNINLRKWFYRSFDLSHDTATLCIKNFFYFAQYNACAHVIFNIGDTISSIEIQWTEIRRWINGNITWLYATIYEHFPFMNINSHRVFVYDGITVSAITIVETGENSVQTFLNYFICIDWKLFDDSFFFHWKRALVSLWFGIFQFFAKFQ